MLQKVLRMLPVKRQTQQLTLSKVPLTVLPKPWKSRKQHQK